MIPCPEYAFITGNPDELRVVELATNTVVNTITIPGTPIGVCVSPDGSKILVTRNTSNAVDVVCTATQSVLATIALGSLKVAKRW